MEASAAAPALDIVSVESGVDWVTYTAPPGPDGERLLTLGYGLIREQEHLGAKRSGFGSQGYRGEQVEHAACGERDDSVYLRISGGLACSSWGEIGTSGGHPTRLDLQTTFLLKQSSVECGQRMFSETPTQQRQRGRPPLYSFSRDTAGAWIGRAGSRSSRAYVRVYDKGQESKSHPPGLRWRIEAELKRDYAEAQWKSLQRAPDAKTHCYASSQFWAQRCGLEWPLPTSSEKVVLQPLPETLPPDVTASLQWLRTQVRPTVERLVRAGLEPQLLHALGLDVDMVETIRHSPSKGI